MPNTDKANKLDRTKRRAAGDAMPVARGPIVLPGSKSSSVCEWKALLA
jgi:hypothetical protein